MRLKIKLTEKIEYHLIFGSYTIGDKELCEYGWNELGYCKDGEKVQVLERLAFRKFLLII